MKELRVFPEVLELFDIPAAPVMREDLNYSDDLGSLLAELYMIAVAVEQERMSEIGGVTRRKMLLIGDDFCYPVENGENTPYVKMFEISRKTYAENQKLVERFVSEEIVWRSAGLMAHDIKIGDAIVIISPPREIYRFLGQPALSATFILRRVSGEEFEAFSLYVPEIDEDQHKQIVGMPRDMSEYEVLETPILVESEIIDRIVTGLGFAGWNEVIRRSLNLDGQQELEKTDIYRAIVRLRGRFEDEKETIFWLGFADMIRDLLLKDVMGIFEDLSENEIYQEGMLFLRVKNRGKLNNKLAWVFGMEGMDDQRLQKWIVDQQALQQRVVYQAMWGGHGNGSSMLSFDDKNSFLDSRTIILTDGLKNREKRKSDCSKCRKPLNSEGKCERCK
ncbi:MAG: hypothetical protein ACD_40C00246G0004 [uncultured bacterium]|nr:MAG: hypothetical protein ACD_40C00246G0004 [uncultured bacterium]